MDEITDYHIDQGWFDITRVGEWEGSKGGKPSIIKITQQDLKDMAADYSPKLQEAPIDTDHWGFGPALGWVSELRVAGDKLQAKLTKVSDQLREWLKSGAYRSRSVAMDMPHISTGRVYLTALSFLGAAPPAAKGLDPVPHLFHGGASNSFVWIEPAGEEQPPLSPFNNGEKESSEKKEETTMDEATITKSVTASVTDTLKSFFGSAEKTELSEKLKQAEARLSESESKTAELNTSLEAEKKRANEAEAKLAETQKAAELSEFKEKIEQAKKESRLTPAEGSGYTKLGERLDTEGRKAILEEVAERKDNGLLGEHSAPGQNIQLTGRMASERAALKRVIKMRGGEETEDDKHTAACYDLMEVPGNEKLSFSEASVRIRAQVAA